jgi:hypothetical protein
MALRFGTTRPGGQGFFADASNMMMAGDMVMISAHDGGRVAAVAKRQGAVALAELQA